MSDYTPVNSDNTAFTSTAAATITGGQLLEVAANGTVQPAAGTARPVGVAAHDAPNGGRVTVYVLPGMIHEVLIKNTIVMAAGAPVIPASAAGLVDFDATSLAHAAAAGTLIGICLKGGTGDGTTVKARFIGV